MNLKLLIIIFILGLTVGFLALSDLDSPTGLSTQNSNCFVENNLCECSKTECICGNLTVDVEVCETSLSIRNANIY